MESISERLARYLAHRMPEASDLEISGLTRIHGGASRETYRCTARWQEHGLDYERGLVLRRDPVGSLIETERSVEYAAYATFQDSEVPVPELWFLEEDERWLERPFFVMTEAPGQAANPFASEPYGSQAEAIGEQFWRILGKISSTTVTGTPIAAQVDAPGRENAWRRELDHWENVIDADELVPQPIVRAAIRWLRRNPPPPPERLAIVHGDYRTGNFLFDEQGRVTAILDWEMCHLGDPLEDLGWALDPLWAGTTPERPGQLLDRTRGIATWEGASGLTVDQDALRWGEIFAHVKGSAIWISGSREYASGTNHDPVLLISGWLCTARHAEIIAERFVHLLEERP